MVNEMMPNFGKEKFPNIFKDPFNKINVMRIFVQYSQNWNGSLWTAIGWVEFKNGDTEGKQVFNGSNFDEVVLKMKIFIEQEIK